MRPESQIEKKRKRKEKKEKKGREAGRCQGRSWIFWTHRTPVWWRPLNLNRVRSLKGETVEKAGSGSAREEQGVHHHLLPRNVKSVWKERDRASVVKGDRGATEGGEGSTEVETKAREGD